MTILATGAASAAPATSFTCIEDVDLPAESYLFDGLVPMQGLTVISGQPKAGKSQIALAMAMALCAGEPFAGDDRFRGALTGQPVPVNWIGSDGGWVWEVKERIGRYPAAARRNFYISGNPGDEGLIFDQGQVSGALQSWQAHAQRMAREGIRCVIIDHLYNLAGTSGVNEDTAVSAVMRAMGMISEAGIVPILLHHASVHRQDGKAAPMGHSLIQATMRSNLQVRTANQRSKSQTIDVISNSAPQMQLRVKPLKCEGVEVISWGEPASRESSREDSESGKRKSNRDGIHIRRARAIVAAPADARASQTAAGQYLATLGPDLWGDAKDFRQVVVGLVKKGLLAAEPSGMVVAGPALRLE